MEYFSFAIAIIVIIIIFIIRYEKFFRIKKWGISTNAEVLGYYLKPPYYNALYIALKFKDSTNKEIIILTEYNHVKKTYPSVYPYKIGAIINIKYIRHSENYKIDSPLVPITLLKGNKKIQPNDDGNIYEIGYLSHKTINEYLLVIIPLIIIIILIIAIFLDY